MASTKSTQKPKHLQLVTKPTWERIEELARTAAATGICDRERQAALVLLLDELSDCDDARSFALTARNAAFGNATELLDPAIDQVLSDLRKGVVS